ncbi:MAG: 4-alpha-glucanotransferase [Muribaculaceae bacterium]|nr:4-alpha-glucanotransferase [Muribaculaceae bacterium]
MTLTFNIDYRTNWGENIFIIGDIPELGSADPAKAVPLHPASGERWTLRIEVADGTPDFSYRYFIRHDNGWTRQEYGDVPHRFIHARGGAADFILLDRWQDMPWDKPYYSSAFTDCINRRTSRHALTRPSRGSVRIVVAAPMIAPGETLAIVGDCKALGNWDPSRALTLSDHSFPVWTVDIPASRHLPPAFDYKFLILDAATGAVRAWEGGSNRHAVLPSGHSAEPGVTVISGLRFNSARALWRGAGVAIPVFSIRTEADFGVGDFFDLIPMIDWAAATGQKFLQILPINDTTMTHTWMDSYPYNANSTFALHPMYLRLSELGTLSDPDRQRYFDDLARELNALEQIDYERVTAAKTAFTREIFEQDGHATLASPDYRRFLADNARWLRPYAAFCVLRDRFSTPDFSLWGEYAVYDPAKIDAFIDANPTDIQFVCYVQFHLDRQMRHVSDYARSRGIAIKGDIPIGISRTSVDAWIYPRLFNLNSQAGAPPDDFSVLGQNWGFPTYNWEEMSLDGFAWWKARFRKMAEYFDAYRIDHVLGFFRIWQIPADAIHGLLGIFNPALPFTPQELSSHYDFWINPEVQCRPFIMDWFLPDFFGPYVDEARSRFLIDADGYGRYSLRPEFSTQRQVADYFATQEKNDKNTLLCNALLGLIDDVLFIEDPVERGKYHPRISAQHTYSYRALDDYARWCFDRLYNDFFYHRHNHFWYDKAMWKLPPLISATHMLTCAEDLGMIPDCVPAVMNELKIVALEIQRMPKDPRHEFGQTRHYPYLSVCTTSTHDMGGIRQWWEENRQTTQRFYNNELHQHGDAPYYAEPWICRMIVDQHLKSPSMLCILPLQDWLSTDGELRRANPFDEQINVPANSRHYWRYRMHLTVEQLLAATDLNASIRAMIADSAR